MCDRNDSGKRMTYESPELVKIGSVKNLTLGSMGGKFEDSGGAGSYDFIRFPP
jgi:hypothetical protein